MKKKFFLFLLVFPFILAFQKPKPTLFLIGDSTVKTGAGKGENDMWGWGTILPSFFDTTRLVIDNQAIGGRSSRTFLTEGRWEKLLPQFKKGDFLIIQFGHNDDWPLNDTLRARGTIKGIGEEVEEIDNVITKKHEVVHTFGWYMRKYANEAKAKAVQVIICSPVPRNNFDENGKIKRPMPYYSQWAEQVAQQAEVDFINLHELSAVVYEDLGPVKVKEMYFTPKDNIHTNKAGAMLNAQKVVEGVKSLKKSKLKKYITSN